MRISCKVVDSEEEYLIARKIRTIVFIVEQSVPVEEEFDDLDGISTHVIAFADGEAAAAARITFFEDRTKIGRVAVLKEKRGAGIGTAIMRFIIDVAKESGKRPIYGNGQSHAVEFYERLGFRKEGDEFTEAGILHYRMVLE